MNISKTAKKIARNKGIKCITENKMIKRFNELGDIAKNHPNICGAEFLRKLSPQDLCIFFAGKTYAFGRAFEESWENGLLHFENDAHREKISMSFSRHLDDFFSG